MTAQRTTTRPAFALIEAVLAMVVVSVMLVASLRVVGASAAARAASADRLRGLCLAQDLMAEIMSKSYTDPQSPGTWGLTTAETAAGRPSFDDADDYNGLTESPPKDRSGNAIAGTTGWQRSVAVAWVSLADPSQTVGAESGVKRVTITVRRGGKKAAQLVSLRAASVSR